MVSRHLHPAAADCPDCRDHYLCDVHLEEWRSGRPFWGREGRLAGYSRSPPGMGLLAALVLGVVVAGFVATQAVAGAYHFHPNLGPPLGEFMGRPIYAPWDVVGWHLRFGQTARAVFEDAERKGLVIGGVAAGATFLASFSRWLHWMNLRTWLS